MTLRITVTLAAVLIARSVATLAEHPRYTEDFTPPVKVITNLGAMTGEP